MSTNVASSRIAILLLFVGVLAGISYGQLHPRRVCPTVKNYKPARLCRNVTDRCASDDECTNGAERCCPTEGESYLSCQKTVITSACPIPIDLALLLDSSGSIGWKNWKKLQNFTKDLVDAFDISENGTHIAIMPYSTKPVIEIKFNKYKGVKLNGVSIKRDIDGFRLQRGLTYIDRALALADKELFTEAAGMRKNVKKVVLVLTDGIQTKDNMDNSTKLVDATKPLKKRGFYIHSLGVGSDVDVMEMIQTASSIEFVYSMRNFDDLARKVIPITDKMCEDRCPTFIACHYGSKYCRKGIAYCRCQPGYYGKNCQKGCKYLRCDNGGTKACVRHSILFYAVPKCICKIGFHGKHCEKNTLRATKVPRISS